MPLAETFLAFVSDDLRGRLDAASVDRTLGAALTAARAEVALPSVSDEDFAAHAAERLGPELAPLDDPAAALAGVQAVDLLIALGCRRGDERALAAFDARFGTDVDLAIKKSPSLGVAPDEFRQLVRTRLFVNEPDRPAKIASYSGRGPLKGWVWVTAVRLVVDLARQSTPDRPEGDDRVFDRLPGALDLETEVIRAASRHDLNEAMKRAFSRLEVRDRNLLRQRYVHDLSGDKIAQLHGVHRATAFGWIEDARKTLLKRIEEELGGRAGNRELASLLAALGSRLDISLRAVMTSEDGV